MNHFPEKKGSLSALQEITDMSARMVENQARKLEKFSGRKAAIDFLREALLLKRYERDVDLLLRLGRLYWDEGCREEGCREEAEKWLRQALQIEPDHLKGIKLFTRILIYQDKACEAEILLHRFRTIAPDDIGIVNRLGSALIKQEKYREAKRVLLAGNDICRDNIANLQLLGEVSLRQGQIVEAEKWLGQARLLRPEDGDVLYLLAEVKMVAGRFDSAETLLSFALSKNPESKRLRGALDKMRERELGQSLAQTARKEKILSAKKNKKEKDLSF